MNQTRQDHWELGRLTERCKAYEEQIERLREALHNARCFVRLFHDDVATVCLREIDAALGEQAGG